MKVIKKSLFKIILTGIFSVLIVSCENFLQGANLADNIQNSINYANSNPSKILITSDSTATSQILPAAGYYEKKATDKFDLSFEPNSGYKFISWKATPENAISFENAASNKTTATVLLSNTEITISPNVIGLLKVSKNFPAYSSTGEARDTSISIEFSDVLNKDSFYFSQEEQDQIINEKLAASTDFITDSQGLCYAYKQYGETLIYKNIKIECDNVSYLSYFGAPTVSNNTLVIPVDSENYIPVESDKTKNISVVVSKNVISSSNISMAEDFTWTYKINSSTLGKLTLNPVCDSGTGNFTLNANTKYSINESFTLTFITTQDYEFRYWDYDNTKLYLENPKSATTKAIVLAGTVEATTVKAVCSLTAAADRVIPEWADLRIGRTMTDVQNGTNIISTKDYSANEWEDSEYTTNHFLSTSGNMNVWFYLNATDDNSGVKECTVRETLFELLDGTRPETVVNTQSLTFEEGERNSATACVNYQAKSTQDGIIKLEVYGLTDKNGNVNSACSVFYIIRDSGILFSDVLIGNNFNPTQEDNFTIQDHGSYSNTWKLESFTLNVPVKKLTCNRNKKIQVKVLAGTDLYTQATEIDIGNCKDGKYEFRITDSSSSNPLIPETVVDGLHTKDVFLKIILKDDIEYKSFYTVIPRAPVYASIYRDGSSSYFKAIIIPSYYGDLYLEDFTSSKTINSNSQVTNHWLTEYWKYARALFYSKYSNENSVIYSNSTNVPKNIQNKDIVPLSATPPSCNVNYTNCDLGKICSISLKFNDNSSETTFAKNYNVYAKVDITENGITSSKLILFEETADNTFKNADLLIPEKATATAMISYCNASDPYNKEILSLGLVNGTSTLWGKNIEDSKKELYSIPLTYYGNGYVNLDGFPVDTSKITDIVYYYKKLSDIKNLDTSIFNGTSVAGQSVTFGPMVLIENNIVTKEEVESAWDKLPSKLDSPLEFPVLYLPETGDYAVFVKATVKDGENTTVYFDGFRLNWENKQEINCPKYSYMIYFDNKPPLYYQYNLGRSLVASISYFDIDNGWESFAGKTSKTMSFNDIISLPVGENYYFYVQVNYSEKRWGRYFYGEASFNKYDKKGNMPTPQEGYNIKTYSPNLWHNKLSGDSTTYTYKNMVDGSLGVLCYFDQYTLVETYSSPIDWGGNVEAWDLHTPADRITNTKEIKTSGTTPEFYNVDLSVIPANYYYCVIAHLSDGTKAISSVRKKY